MKRIELIKYGVICELIIGLSVMSVVTYQNINITSKNNDFLASLPVTYENDLYTNLTNSESADSNNDNVNSTQVYSEVNNEASTSTKQSDEDNQKDDSNNESLDLNNSGFIIDDFNENSEDSNNTEEGKTEDEKKFIKWVDFNVCTQALNDAYNYDIKSKENNNEVSLNWIELLAYIASRNGGNFSKYKTKDMDALVEKIKSKKEDMSALTKDLKYYKYYLDAYTAVLGGLVGEYEIEVADENNPDQKVWIKKYGLKAFSPIAKFYDYHDYDDFGVSRSYGFKRQHLGHDMMGQVGTPIIAVESGYVEALGWNQYGGWRIGIRSFDKKRYYYYAHLRRNFPFNKSLKIGSVVQAGDVIGYLGRTGYSRTENVNNIDTSHLHFGLQLIFDESQKEGNNEIWIDCYSLTKFLYKNRCETVKNLETKEYSRVYDMRDPLVEEYLNKMNTKGN